VSAAVASRGALRDLIDAWLTQRAFVVVSSEEILDDAQEALERSYFAKRLSRSDRVDFMALIRREVILVTPRTEVHAVVKDPDDDLVLAAAVDGEARYLVTGDRGLLDVASFRGVEIVTARQFMELTRSS
jgi:putative PIN family toxin of toxin-antitoxin system